MIKRNKDTFSLKEGIDAWLKETRMSKKFDITRINAEWEQIVGKLISDRTTKLFVKENKLFLKVDSAPLKKELQLSKENLKNIILEYTNNENFITDIVIL